MRTVRPLDGVMGAIRAANRIALISHVSPDGDTVCSALAMRLGLLELGKQVDVFCQDAIPQLYQFLPGVEDFSAPEAAQAHYELLLCLDVSDEKRMGRCRALVERAERTAQVDHHGTNTLYCDVNCVDATAPANCLILYELLKRLGCTITQDIALCLAVGLSTDTGHLTYNSTTPEAYRVMADLMEAGAPIAEAYRRLYRERPPRQVALLVKALEGLTYHDEGRITAIRLTQQDFDDCGALPEDAEIIVNNGLDILGVRMCVFGREQADGSVKLSFRAIPPYQVSSVAQSFGGGGHAQAAGASVHLPLDEAIAQAVKRMQAELEQNA
ncbi:MAG: DHH family phosphoesterase [Clostridiales bacterium]|nr:DHH family phosphoesterase [Clostridiales bacterium]